ncbi:hypothetical protein RJ640_010143 [Escallonia rubra]|uniref:Uncharacterized protein n=1 Tax=Escallonia rubra TaxID=112253 RepID=A0AA88UA22_9ASTE|nr:hypothetical protein RJ640_010143 [Escallonia rubra]
MREGGGGGGRGSGCRITCGGGGGKVTWRLFFGMRNVGGGVGDGGGRWRGGTEMGLAQDGSRERGWWKGCRVAVSGDGGCGRWDWGTGMGMVGDGVEGTRVVEGFAAAAAAWGAAELVGWDGGRMSDGSGGSRRNGSRWRPEASGLVCGRCRGRGNANEKGGFREINGLYRG